MAWWRDDYRRGNLDGRRILHRRSDFDRRSDFNGWRDDRRFRLFDDDRDAENHIRLQSDRIQLRIQFVEFCFGDVVRFGDSIDGLTSFHMVQVILLAPHNNGFVCPFDNDLGHKRRRHHQP